MATNTNTNAAAATTKATTAPAKASTKAKDDSNVEALARQHTNRAGIYSAASMDAVIVHNQTTKDWTYLASKAASDSHVLYAKMVTDLSGVAIAPEQVMALLAMHRWMQASTANQERPDFKGRTVESVLKGSATLAERAASIAAKAPNAPVVPAKAGQDGYSAPASPVALEAAAPAKPAAPAKAKPAPRRAPAKATPAK